jgi:hypothetical protein
MFLTKFSKANNFYQLKDLQLRSRFQHYYLQQETTLCCPVAASLSFLLESVLLVALAFQSAHMLERSLASLICVLSVGIGLLGISIAWLHRRLEHEDFQSPTPSITTSPSFSFYKQWLLRANHIYFIATTCLVILFVSRRALSPLCVNFHNEWFDDLFDRLFCGHHLAVVAGDGVFPLDAMLLLCVTPISMAILFPSLDVAWIWAQLVVFLTVFGIIAVWTVQSPSGLFVVVWLVSDIVVIATLQSQKIATFYMHLSLEEAIARNAKCADDFHVEEMRFLIANLAHDLKSVRFSSYLFA